MKLYWFDFVLKTKQLLFSFLLHHWRQDKYKPVVCVFRPLHLVSTWPHAAEDKQRVAGPCRHCCTAGCSIPRPCGKPVASPCRARNEAPAQTDSEESSGPATSTSGWRAARHSGTPSEGVVVEAAEEYRLPGDTDCVSTFRIRLLRVDLRDFLHRTYLFRKIRLHRIASTIEEKKRFFWK